MLEKDLVSAYTNTQVWGQALSKVGALRRGIMNPSAVKPQTSHLGCNFFINFVNFIAQKTN